MPGPAHRWPYHPDEGMLLLGLARLRENLPWPVLHPYDHAWGGAFFGLYGAWTAAGAALGVFPIGGEEVYRADPAALGRVYLWARLLTASLGAATVWRVAALGRRLGMDEGAALAAAAVLAVMPHPVQHGRFITVHTLSALASVVLLETLVAGGPVAAGLAAGVLAACEHSFLVAIPFAAAVVWRRAGRGPALRAALVAGAVWGALNPGVVVDPGGWRAAQRGQAHVIDPFGLGPLEAVRILGPAAGFIALAAGAGGLARLRLPGAWTAIVLLVGGVALGNPFARRYATIYPLLALGLASWPRRAGAGLLAAALLEGALRTGAIAMSFGTADTRTEAAAWIEKNVPPASTVGLQNWFFAPHIPVDRYRVTLGRAETRPTWYVSTEFNWEEREVLEAAGYRLEAEFRRPHRLGPLVLRDMHWPEDMRYVNPTIRVWRMAGEAGIEPAFPDPKSGVLPLDDSPPS